MEHIEALEGVHLSTADGSNQWQQGYSTEGNGCK